MHFFSALSSQFHGITVIHVQYPNKTQSFLELAFFKLRNQSLRILGHYPTTPFEALRSQTFQAVDRQHMHGE